MSDTDEKTTDPEPGIEITVRDLVTGETGTRTLTGDDYCLVTSGRTYISHKATHASGTHQLTIKVDKGGEN